MTTQELPRADILEEADRILGAAGRGNITLCLIGGLAVRMHANGPMPPALEREPNDIDLVTVRGMGAQVRDLLTGLGYVPAEEFNHLNGHRRLLFHDLVHGRRVDVFVGVFEMCHAIPIADRLALDSISVPLAELLLTKLQVVRLNEKDQRDIIAILVDHSVSETDEDSVNAAYIARLCARDWGLWRTTTMNLRRCGESLERYALPEPALAIVTGRLSQLSLRIAAEPKSAKWRLRSRIGDRIRWYEEPEEVD